MSAELALQKTWLCGFVCAFQPSSPAAMGSNPKQEIYVFLMN